MSDKNKIIDNLNLLKNKIGNIDIIAITKTHTFDVYKICCELGLNKIGENKVQEAFSKWEMVNKEKLNLETHLVGNLQSNKIKYLNNLLYSYDALSSLEHLKQINSLWDNKQYSPLKILIQINSSNELQKSGFLHTDISNIIHCVKECLSYKKNIILEGFMTIGPTPNSSIDSSYLTQVSQSFGIVRNIKEKIEQEFNIKLPRLSMGMTHDYEIAIQEGATEIRIGSLLFGNRIY